MALYIFWTSTARRQRTDIFKYWNKKNGSTDYSRKVKEQVAFRLEQLAVYPEAGKETDFTNTRVTALGHFSIFYQITKDKLVVTCFWDNRNDPGIIKDLLDKN